MDENEDTKMEIMPTTSKRPKRWRAKSKYASYTSPVHQPIRTSSARTLSDTRSHAVEDEVHYRSENQWNQCYGYGSATHVNEDALKAALAQHNAHPSFEQPSGSGPPGEIIYSFPPTHARHPAFPISMGPRYDMSGQGSSSAHHERPSTVQGTLAYDERRLETLPTSPSDSLETMPSNSAVIPSSSNMPWQIAPTPPYGYFWPAWNGQQHQHQHQYQAPQYAGPQYVDGELYSYPLENQHVLNPSGPAVSETYGQYANEIEQKATKELEMMRNGQEQVAANHSHSHNASDNENDEEMEVDNAPQSPQHTSAAESLLVLHSTPGQPVEQESDHIPSSILKHISEDTPARPPSIHQSVSNSQVLDRVMGRAVSQSTSCRRSESTSILPFPAQSSDVQSQPSRLMDAPEIREAIPRPPRPIRAMSLIGPAIRQNAPQLHSPVPRLSGRSNVPSRSLSFGKGPDLAAAPTSLDDPFALTPIPLSKKRRSTIASPSPLIKRKRDEIVRSRPLFNDVRPVAEARIGMLNSRSNSSQADADVDADAQTEADCAAHLVGQVRVSSTSIQNKIVDPTKNPVLAPEPSSPASRLPLHLLRSNQCDSIPLFSSTANTVFTTPSRPAARDYDHDRIMMPPTSLSKVWLFSSPGNGETAASLGLVPHWAGLAGEFGTPGMNGMDVVCGETPARWSVVRSARRGRVQTDEEGKVVD